MTPEHASVFATKATVRRMLAALPIAEKLRLLDELRVRELALRAHRAVPQAAANPAKGSHPTKAPTK